MQLDPTQAPIPLIDPAEEVAPFYDEEVIEGKLGKWGFLRPPYKVVSWLGAVAEKILPEKIMKSKAASRRKKHVGLFELPDEDQK